MNSFNKLFGEGENSWVSFLLLFTLSIIIGFSFFIYWKLQKIKWEKIQLKKLAEEQKKRTQQIQQQEKKLTDFNQQLQTTAEKLKLTENKLEQEEKNIKNLNGQLFQKEQSFIQRFAEVSQKEKNIEQKTEKLEKLKKEATNQLAGTISMSREEAKKHLLDLLKEEINYELEKYKEEKFTQTEAEIAAESTKMICLSLEKYSSDLVFTKTTDTLEVENSEIIGRIIGREGRNIIAFRKITSTDLIIDQETEDLNIKISSFNSLRREMAFQTLKILVKEEKISPVQIEKTYQKVVSEINNSIIKTGKEILQKLELRGVHPELVKHLGRLKYRTSYGQNVLEHSLEVAKLTGSIAAELNLDVLLARRAGLFHDIGKAVEEEEKNNHVLSGISLAKKYQEPEIVINTIASHHGNFPANNFYSLIVLATDRLSAARPGARGYQLETYIERMNSLEKIANDFPGIKKSYSFQAGREIWVIADAEKLSDRQTWEISNKIKEKIKKEIAIPGEVTIHVVREKKFTHKLYDKKAKEKSEKIYKEF